jgi:hypothetical protein
MKFYEIIGMIPEIRLRHLMNLLSIFIDSKFEQNFYVKWGGDSWVHTFRNVCLYQSEVLNRRFGSITNIAIGTYQPSL